MENKKCLKPPTSIYIYIYHLQLGYDLLLTPHPHPLLAVSEHQIPPSLPNIFALQGWAVALRIELGVPQTIGRVEASTCRLRFGSGNAKDGG